MTPTDLRLADALGHDASDKRLDILQRIGVAGSISEAARAAGVSYKAAWQAIETLSNLAGAALVEKVVGGTGGGGARLTAAGHQLLRASRLLNDARQEVLARLALDAEHGARLPSLAGLGLRTSMRNQLPGTVAALALQGLSIRVTLALADGTPLCSRVTSESAQLLGLRPGRPVLALCKATAVRVARVIDPCEGYNVLHGHVTRATACATGGEVSLSLPGGLSLVGFAQSGHGMRGRCPAMACVEESGVVIAVPS